MVVDFLRSVVGGDDGKLVERFNIVVCNDDDLDKINLGIFLVFDLKGVRKRDFLVEINERFFKL